MLSALAKAFAPVIQAVAKVIAPVVNAVNKAIQKATGGQGVIAQIAQSVTNAVNTSANHKSDDKPVRRGTTGNGQTRSAAVTRPNTPTGSGGAKPDRTGGYIPPNLAAEQPYGSDRTTGFTDYSSMRANSVSPIDTHTDVLLDLFPNQTQSGTASQTATDTLATLQAQHDESCANLVQSLPEQYQYSTNVLIGEGWNLLQFGTAHSLVNNCLGVSVPQGAISPESDGFLANAQATSTALNKANQNVAPLQIVPGGAVININPDPGGAEGKVDDPGEYFPVDVPGLANPKQQTGEELQSPIKEPTSFINKIFNEAEELAKFREWFKTTPMGQAEEKAREALKKFWNVNFSGADELGKEPYKPMPENPTPEQLEYENNIKYADMSKYGIVSRPGSTPLIVPYDYDGRAKPDGRRVLVSTTQLKDIQGNPTTQLPATFYFKEGSEGAKKAPQGIYILESGFPVLIPYALVAVNIGRFTGNRDDDFELANAMAGFKNDQGKVTKKSNPEGTTWHHHEDTQTMLLVYTAINRLPHSGGHSIMEWILNILDINKNK